MGNDYNVNKPSRITNGKGFNFIISVRFHSFCFPITINSGNNVVILKFKNKTLKSTDTRNWRS